MSIIIDGYNLIAAVGIIGRGVGPGGLERARLALLNFLAESLPPGEIGGTTVVFDAKNAPPGLPRIVNHRGLTVRFASRYPDADSLIEELIVEESSPRGLTVVSSDHRIQRAARRRKAVPVDSDVWHAGVVRGRRERQANVRSKQAEAKPPAPLLGEDVDYWVRFFGGESLLNKLVEGEAVEEELGSKLPRQDKPADAAEPEDAGPPETSTQDDKRKSCYNPFPSGHADDLLKEDDLDGGTCDLFPPGYGEDLEEPDDLG